MPYSFSSFAAVLAASSDIPASIPLLRRCSSYSSQVIVPLATANREATLSLKFLLSFVPSVSIRRAPIRKVWMGFRRFPF